MLTCKGSRVFLRVVFFLFFFIQVSMAETVLLIGDSMAEAVAKPLEKLFNTTNYQYVYRFKRGTQVTYWLDNPELEEKLQSSDPDYVLISLGTNDIVAKKSNEAIIESLDKLMEYIQALSSKKINFLVVATPLQADNDLNLAMQEHYGESCFVSKSLNLETNRDKVHPTHEADEVWAQQIYEYFMDTYPTLSPTVD